MKYIKLIHVIYVDIVDIVSLPNCVHINTDRFYNVDRENR